MPEVLDSAALIGMVCSTGLVHGFLSELDIEGRMHSFDVVIIDLSGTAATLNPNRFDGSIRCTKSSEEISA